MKWFKHMDLNLELVLSALTLAGLTACNGQKIVPLNQGELTPPALTVTLVIKDYCPINFVDFFVKPMSFEVQNGTLEQDTNRDGLTDNEALFFGLSPFDQPTTGITDFIGIEFLGLTASQLPSIPQCPNVTQSSSGDVLTDCQKNALGLVPLSGFDTAHRGFPDSLAVYARLPLLDSNVATEDLAGDGVATIQKIKWNLPPDETLTPQSQLLQVTYSIDTYASTTQVGATCYNFTVTSPRAGVSNGDLFNFYFISTNTSGLNTLVTKGVVVAASVPNGATQEYEYEGF